MQANMWFICCSTIVSHRTYSASNRNFKVCDIFNEWFYLPGNVSMAEQGFEPKSPYPSLSLWFSSEKNNPFLSSLCFCLLVIIQSVPMISLFRNSCMWSIHICCFPSYIWTVHLTKQKPVCMYQFTCIKDKAKSTCPVFQTFS